jgi:hypothetical protein
MIESKSKFWTLLPILLAILCTGLLYFTGKTFLTTESTFTKGYMSSAFLLTFAVWIWILFIELRTKATKVIVDEDTITIKNILGMGWSQKHRFDELDGFAVSSIPNGLDENWECLYLLKNKRKVAKISAFYYENYLEIKDTIHSRTFFLGEEPFDVLSELKEQLQ